MRLAFAAVLALSTLGADLDRDGLDDKFEERLLKKFRPTLLIDAQDCDVRPAEFTNGQPGARNGTLYGHVFRVKGGIEIHYYHLWANDCGRGAHPLDAEHVAVLLEPHGRDWRARAWIAAGHAGTICDRRHGALASALNAVDRGATVWVSYGKHASFLSQQACGGGCGGDRCDRPVTLAPGKLVNLGEAAAPMPGYDWIRQRQGVLHLTSKMTSEFTETDLAALHQDQDKLVSLTPIPRPAQAFVLGGNAALNGMGTGGKHTESALSTAGEQVDRALATSYEKVKGSLQKARRWWNR
jgi:hypothetical protein